MAVKVNYIKPGMVGSVEVDHPTGTYLDVSDGHLFVRRKDGTHGRTVAVYAPKQWATAKVEEAAD